LSRSAFFVDINRCTNCDLCALTCSFVKENLYSLNRSRIWIVKDISRALGVPVICENCENPPCAKVCPVNALTKNHETGIVELNESKCIGCRECIWICPFGAISIDPKKGKAVKCDLCGGDPECVKACLYGALRFERIDRPSTLMKKRENIQRKLEALASIAVGEVK